MHRSKKAFDIYLYFCTESIHDCMTFSWLVSIKLKLQAPSSSYDLFQGYILIIIKYCMICDVGTAHGNLMQNYIVTILDVYA